MELKINVTEIYPLNRSLLDDRRTLFLKRGVSTYELEVVAPNLGRFPQLYAQFDSTSDAHVVNYYL